MQHEEIIGHVFDLDDEARGQLTERITGTETEEECEKIIAEIVEEQRERMMGSLPENEGEQFPHVIFPSNTYGH